MENEPLVVECYHVTGDYSYLVKVDAKEIGDLERLIIKFQKMGRTRLIILLPLREMTICASNVTVQVTTSSRPIKKTTPLEISIKNPSFF